MGAAQASSPTRAPTSRNTPKMEIPAAYAATLAHVRAVFPGALIAGGCLRDMDNASPVKDIEIFTPHAARAFEEVRRLGASLYNTSGATTGMMGKPNTEATEELEVALDSWGTP